MAAVFPELQVEPALGGAWSSGRAHPALRARRPAWKGLHPHPSGSGAFFSHTLHQSWGAAGVHRADEGGHGHLAPAPGSLPSVDACPSVRRSRRRSGWGALTFWVNLGTWSWELG